MCIFFQVCILTRFNFLTKEPKFFNAEDDDKNVERIKTAIEWAFGSKINENETFAYIQTCIALDSILGKEDSDEQRSLTETVADRGSYLLGKNIEERKKIYLQLRKLLKVRGKLVHGRNLRLKDEDRKFLLRGQDILSRAIIKELSYL